MLSHEDQEALQDINSKMMRLDDEIDAVLIRQNVGVDSLLGVQQFRHDIDLSIGRVQQLADILSTATMLAERVNYHVRTLDKLQRNAKEASKRVSDLADLKQCTDGLQQSLKQGDLATASAHAERFLQMDSAVADDPNAARMSSLILEGAVKAEQAIEEARMRDGVSKEEFFRLLDTLKRFGRADKTAKMYGRWVCDRLHVEMGGLQDPNKQPADGPSVVSKSTMSPQDQVLAMLDIVAALVEEELPRLQKIFPAPSGQGVTQPGRFIRAVAGAENHHDDYAVLVLKTLQEESDKLMEPMLRRMIANLSGLQLTDPKEMDYWMDALSQMLQKCELYDAFMKDVLKDTSLVTALRRNIVEILGQYIRLSEMYIRTTIASIVGTSDQEELVDDCFFVLEAVQTRAQTTGNKNVVSTTVHTVLAVLTETLLPDLVNQEAWNAIEQAGRFVQILKDHLEDKSLADNYEEVATNFKKTLHKGLGKIAKDLFVERVKPLFAPLEKMSFVLDERQFCLYEAEDPFVTSFTARFDKILQETDLRRRFSENNFDLLMRLFAEHSIRYYEKIVMSKRGFNQLGGLQLDKDVRNFSNYFSSLCKATVRDRFQRMFQIAALLNLDKLSEFRDFYGPRAGPLDARAVRDVLKLRVDFGEQAVERLNI
jgi:hypothetical protein